MDNFDNMKALFIIINAGFADEVIDIARANGANGATIINSRGEGTVHKSFMGISIDSEKEVVLTLVDGQIAEKIMDEIKEKAGIKSPAHGICFLLPVEKIVGISQPDNS